MSDATQHTPGPWAVSMPGGQTAFNGRRVTVTHNGSMIADLDWNTPAENLANAALIARAPDLLVERDALAKQVSELRASLACIVAALSQPVQTCEPSTRVATVLLGDCTFARQEAKHALGIA